jgi:hypothetical protein
VPDTPAPKAAGGSKGAAFTRKVGPLPVYAWAALAIGGYLVLRKFSSSASAASTPATQPVQPTQSTDASGSGGTAAAPDQSNLLAGLFGNLQAATDINSNLTNALLQNNSEILGFGKETLGLNASLEQSILAGYAPSSSGGGGGGGGGSAPAASIPMAPPPSTPGFSLSKITALSQAKPLVSFTASHPAQFQHLTAIGAGLPPLNLH